MNKAPFLKLTSGVAGLMLAGGFSSAQAQFLTFDLGTHNILPAPNQQVTFQLKNTQASDTFFGAASVFIGVPTGTAQITGFDRSGSPVWARGTLFNGTTEVIGTVGVDHYYYLSLGYQGSDMAEIYANETFSIVTLTFDATGIAPGTDIALFGKDGGGFETMFIDGGSLLDPDDIIAGKLHVVPEPAALAPIFGLGLLAFVGCRRTRS